MTASLLLQMARALDSVFDRVDQPLRPAVQPVDRLVGVGRRLAILDRARVEVTVDAVGDDLRGPPVAATDMTE